MSETCCKRTVPKPKSGSPACLKPSWPSENSLHNLACKWHSLLVQMRFFCWHQSCSKSESTRFQLSPACRYPRQYSSCSRVPLVPFPRTFEKSPQSRGTFPHPFQQPFFLENLQTSQENEWIWFLKRTTVEKNRTSSQPPLK